MTAPPIPCVWTGAVFAPLDRFHNVARAHYGDGQVVRLVEHHERSEASHRHFFAEVRTTFDNLSDEQRLLWPTEDALRKYALCKAGCCDVATHVESSREAANRLAAFLRANKLGDLVVHDGAVVTVLTAWSMRYSAMDKAAFQDAKEKVLAVLSGIIGVTAAQLSRASSQGSGPGITRPEMAA